MYTNEEDNNFTNELSNEDFEVEDENVEVKEEKKKFPVKIIIIIALLIGLVILLFIIFGNSKKKPFVSDTSKTLNINDKFTLTFNPGGYKPSKVEFFSSDETVASVDKNGNSAIVTGKNYGKSYINVNYIIGDTKTTLRCDVNVVGGKSGVNLQNVKFGDGVLLLSIGKGYQLDPTFDPSDSYITSVSYTSGDNNVANVDAKTGYVKGITAGSTDITITVNGNVTGTIPVTVIESDIVPGIVNEPTSFSFKNTDNLKITSGDNVTMDINIEPSNANEDLISWKSSDNNIAIVKKGIVLGVNQGKATITASYKNTTITKDVEVTGKETKVESINVKNGDINVKNGDFGSIEYEVLPANATVKDVIFKSSNIDVAMVDTNGVITGTGVGECTITITSAVDSSIMATVNIKVID